jgi:hypothetical protein
MFTKTKTKTRKASQTTGTCKLIATGGLSLADALDSGNALLAIYPEKGEASSYTVERLGDKGRVTGYRLTRLAEYIVDRKTYDVCVTEPWGWTCDCPDAQFRSRECKHARSLRAALNAAGITSTQKPEPQPQPEPAEPEEEETVEIGAEPPQSAKVCFECGRPSEDFYCDRCNSL